MTEKDVATLQAVQMHIMDEIHRVCQKLNIRYYLIGGSALGAVRHGGIIPWDVDIDIAMPRPDYERFLREGGSEMRSCFSIHDHNTNKGFNCPHALVLLNGSSIVFQWDLQEGGSTRDGIYVDILPLDRCPNDPVLRDKQRNDLLKLKKKFFWMELKGNPGNNWIKRNLVNAIGQFFSIIYSVDKLNVERHVIMKRYMDDDTSKDWCSMASHYSFDKLTMPKEYFGEPQLMAFSSREYYVPQQVINYLEHLFGEYMKLPSKEKQVAQINDIYSASWIDESGTSVHLGPQN